MTKVDKLSIREAVKHFDVSRPTLQKALKSGKVSGVQDGQGTWTIDPSELARVYQPRRLLRDETSTSLVDKFPIENTALPGEVEALKSRLAVAEALAEERGKHLDDLRRMLPSPDRQQRRGWWRW